MVGKKPLIPHKNPPNFFFSIQTSSFHVGLRGNWMLGLSSSLLLASLMNRSFAHLGGPDVCGWMQGPLCSWRELPEKAMTSDVLGRKSTTTWRG